VRIIAYKVYILPTLVLASMQPATTALCVFIAALVLGLAYLNEGLFHYDAISLAQAVEKTYATGSLQPAINGRYGSVVLSAVTYLPFWLAGHTADLPVRLTSIFWYAASIPFFFLFLARYFKTNTIAFSASVLLLSAPIYLSPNTFGKEHGMSLAFLFLALFLLLRGMGNKWWYTASAPALAFSISIREAVLVLIPFYGWLWLRIGAPDNI